MLLSCLLFILVFKFTTSQQQSCPCQSYDTIERECIIYNSKLTCNPQPEILGGKPANILDWPYIISIQINYETQKGPGCYLHYCGGVLIAPNLVLSAAHCYDRYLGVKKEGELKLYSGEPRFYAAHVPSCRHLGSSRGTIGSRSPVTYVHLHPEWDRPKASADLAILVLADSLPGPYIKLQSEFFNPEISEPITIAGWGYINPQESSNTSLYNMRQLYYTELQYVSQLLCKFFVGQFQPGLEQRINQESMICAYNKNADSCSGDSGGPAVLKGVTPDEDVLVGVMSWGPPGQCSSLDEAQAPGIFARVSAFKDWIDEVVAQQQLAPVMRGASLQFGNDGSPQDQEIFIRPEQP